jgi:predicted DNA-binding WGR domain protein
MIVRRPKPELPKWKSAAGETGYSLVIGEMGFSFGRRKVGVVRSVSMRGGPNPFRMRIGRRNRFKTFVGRLARGRDIRLMENAENCAERKVQILVLERRDENRNMARFYVLAIEPTLFGDSALVREWGRIGSWGRRRLDLYADDRASGEALEAWLRRKVRRGYRKTA